MGGTFPSTVAGVAHRRLGRTGPGPSEGHNDPPETGSSEMLRRHPPPTPLFSSRVTRYPPTLTSVRDGHTGGTRVRASAYPPLFCLLTLSFPTPVPETKVEGRRTPDTRDHRVGKEVVVDRDRIDLTSNVDFRGRVSSVTVDRGSSPTCVIPRPGGEVV